MLHKKAKAEIKSGRNLKNLSIFPEDLAEGIGSRRKRWWGYVSIYDNTPKKLPHLPPKLAQLYLEVHQGRSQLERSSHVVKVGVEATC